MNKLMKALSVMMGVAAAHVPGVASACGIDGPAADDGQDASDRLEENKAEAANVFVKGVFGTQGDKPGERKPYVEVVAIERCIDSPVRAELEQLETSEQRQKLWSALEGLGAKRVKMQDGTVKTVVSEAAAKSHPGAKETAELWDELGDAGR